MHHLMLIPIVWLLTSFAAQAQVAEQPLGHEAVFDGLNSYPIIARAEHWSVDLLMVQVGGEIIFMRTTGEPENTFGVAPLTVSEGEVITEVCAEPATYSDGAPCTPTPLALPMMIQLDNVVDGVGPNDIDLLWEVDGTIYSYNMVPTYVKAVDRSGPVPVVNATLGVLQLYVSPFDTVAHAGLLSGSRIIAEGPYTGTVPEATLPLMLGAGAVGLLALQMIR